MIAAISAIVFMPPSKAGGKCSTNAVEGRHAERAVQVSKNGLSVIRLRRLPVRMLAQPRDFPEPSAISRRARVGAAGRSAQPWRSRCSAPQNIGRPGRLVRPAWV